MFYKLYCSESSSCFANESSPCFTSPVQVLQHPINKTLLNVVLDQLNNGIFWAII